MGIQIIKVKSVAKATHDVLRIITEKPPHYQYEPGQATELAINKPEWQNEKRPFTFTSLPQDDNYLEFTIKTYPQHKGVTNELLKLNEGDELIIDDPWGTIGYKGEGVFIAGGAGITPFISIFRHLKSINKIGGNKLIFANKAKADIINENEFQKMLGDNFINILSDEKIDGYAHGFITEDFLKQVISDTSKHFYVCGPPVMMDIVEKQLKHLNVDEKQIVKEGF
ncbi:MAG: FAD-binding oxidoreductase [Bacteroidales bacterium]|nr:FAD-binding oxidoreductase [Bacteroidales bacterium]MDD4384636.1 FAD-binding oxidoreductase [Bacteroidales bacterium]MDY0197120.1 FAD-binding oxidoreductase [Tenuifilaceae bacterium]